MNNTQLWMSIEKGVKNEQMFYDENFKQLCFNDGIFRAAKTYVVY